MFPFFGLGAALQARGHRVTVVVSEHYRPLAIEHGFDFAALVPTAETERLLANPDFWHPIKSMRIASQWGLPWIGEQYETLSRLANSPDTALIASPGVVAARVLQEKRGVPLASVLLQPWMVPSSIAPPIMPARLTLPRWAPPPAKWLYFRGFDAVGDWLVGRKINELRAAIGLPPMRRIFRWWLSPQLVIGMFPAWYGRPQRDWPAQLRLTGFPLYDGRPAAELCPDLVAFCQAGPPAVAFTFGTGMMHSAKLFRAAVDCCSRLAIRGLLLTKYRSQLPAELPPKVRQVEYAPFQQLFPRCAAVVHHGGIGTTATAFAAGVPQLVVPLAFDQVDNAVRVKRLGGGDWIKANRASGARLATALAPLLTAAARNRSSAMAEKMSEHGSGFALAAQLAEQMLPAAR